MVKVYGGFPDKNRRAFMDLRRGHCTIVTAVVVVWTLPPHKTHTLAVGRAAVGETEYTDFPKLVI